MRAEAGLEANRFDSPVEKDNSFMPAFGVFVFRRGLVEESHKPSTADAVLGTIRRVAETAQIPLPSQTRFNVKVLDPLRGDSRGLSRVHIAWTSDGVHQGVSEQRHMLEAVRAAGLTYDQSPGAFFTARIKEREEDEAKARG